ncbi:MAG: AraC family ligand binding domain-containing protein, partial [Bacteroidetes bacterium]|nr:AraC family ligand binding domain-containing protein [Bacteroidota bacterium]
MPKPQIPTHDLYDKLGGTKAFDFLVLKEKKNNDIGEPHRHSYYEIFFFVKGGGTHEIDFEEFQVDSNSLHFISPGQVHLGKRAINSHGLVIQFSREFFHLGSQNKDLLYELPFFNNHSEKPILELSKSDLILVQDLFT